MAQYRRPDLRQDQQVFKWAIILPLAVIASLIFSLVFFNAWYGRPNYPVGLYDATQSVPVVTVRGEEWYTVDQPRDFPDDEMVAIARTDEGYLLYAPKRGGGGGPGPELGQAPAAYDELYLRTTEGQYQPVVPGEAGR